MHHTHHSRTRLRSARTAIIALATLAVVAVAYRIRRAAEMSVADTLTSIGAATCLAGAICAAWRLHVRKLRAEQAEWLAARRRRQDTILDGDEDRQLWDSVPPKTIDEDTIAFGVNVVALNQYRRAG